MLQCRVTTKVYVGACSKINLSKGNFKNHIDCMKIMISVNLKIRDIYYFLNLRGNGPLGREEVSLRLALPQVAFSAVEF